MSIELHKVPSSGNYWDIYFGGSLVGCVWRISIHGHSVQLNVPLPASHYGATFKDTTSPMQAVHMAAVKMRQHLSDLSDELAKLADAAESQLSLTNPSPTEKSS